MTRTDRMIAYDKAIEYARLTGADDGEAAASWFFDGNTTDDTYRTVLQGLDDGDPAVLDTLPFADLSGQWADSLTGPELVDDAIDAAGVVIVDDETTLGDPYAGRESLAADWFSDLCDAYEDAFGTAVQDAIERTARRMVGAA